MPKKKLKIALIFGGTSEERKVSLISAESVYKNFNKQKYELVKIEVTTNSDWISKSLVQLKTCDVAFLALHGPGGEDGTIQGLLELLGIAYTCSGVLASALAMDKQRCKRILAAAGMPVLADILIDSNNFKKHKDLIQKQIQAPVVVKPNQLGSSLGVQIAPKNLTVAIAQALKSSPEVIIEPFVNGREITVPVIGNDDARALSVIEIVPRAKSKFYDYAAKYTQGGSDHLILAPLTSAQTKEVQRLALLAHQILGCRGVTRSDFILDKNGKFWFLETNTIPGFTEYSLVPQSAATVGISFPQLLDKLISLALDKE